MNYKYYGNYNVVGDVDADSLIVSGASTFEGRVDFNDSVYFENNKISIHTASFQLKDNIEQLFGDGFDFFAGYDSSEGKLRFGTGNDCTVDVNIAFEIDASKDCTVKNDLTVGGNLNYSSWRSKEVFLDENTANVANKPTLINRGLFGGYSLPEYASDEELKFRMRVPHSWDGTTNPYFVAITALSAGEDVGDKYKFQIEWQSADIGGVIPDTTQETLTHEVTISDGTAFYGEIISFELDATTIVAGQNLQIRLRRIAPASPSVSNEVIVFHWDSRWKMNKLGTESIQGY